MGLFFGWLMVSTVAWCNAQPTRAQTQPEVNIPPDRYLSHIAFLASDLLKGRGTGSNGIDLAAGYIAGQLASAGLKPGGDEGTYLQTFTLNISGKIKDSTKLEVQGADVNLKMRDDWIPFGFSASGDFKGEVVFAGYGADYPEKKHDDYADVDVKGKVVLMLRREPPSWGEDQRGGFSNHARFATKLQLAAKKGASAVIIVNQESDDGQDNLLRFGRGGTDYGIPAIHMKRAAADTILKAGGLATLTELQKQLDEGATASKALAGVTAGGHVEFEEMIARNVIGVLPGTGPNADEYVVIGAHYDHLGENAQGIHNGADDNASGSAGVIEIARLLAKTPKRNRSVICMTFTGEEMGLLGSQYFCNHPIVPIDKITAMLNMDMIGRLSKEYKNKLAIQGLGTGDVFKSIVEKQTKTAGLDYLPDDSAMGPSDHASFYGAGVPSLFFFTGVHPDYHQIGDDTEKINAKGGAKIAELVYHIALDLINVPSRPTFAAVNRPARNIYRRLPPEQQVAHPGEAASPSLPRVVVGIYPDLNDDSGQKGWRVLNVVPGSGADKAGIKEGDRIIEVNGVKINEMADYTKALKNKKPGDVIDIKIVRDEKEQVVQVKLSAPQ